MIALAAILILLAGCAPAEAPEPKDIDYKGDMMKITSSAFKADEVIPSKHTCEGEDISPELKIADIPKNTKTLAIICDDPDAPVGTFVHWVAWNIPPGDIEEGAKDFNQGTNDFKKIGYGGPCPPAGTHRYFFKVYALDVELGIEKGSTKTELIDAMENHILAQAELIGTYTKGG
jgi:Raf kinase inhibitor-like YbhB/YbcL family protein